MGGRAALWSPHTQGLASTKSTHRVDAGPALLGERLGTLSNGCARPFSTVGDLRDFVRSHLGNPELSFYLCKSAPQLASAPCWHRPSFPLFSLQGVTSSLGWDLRWLSPGAQLSSSQPCGPCRELTWGPAPLPSLASSRSHPVAQAARGTGSRNRVVTGWRGPVSSRGGWTACDPRGDSQVPPKASLPTLGDCQCPETALSPQSSLRPKRSWTTTR